ncbi:hypothetical protein Dimus_034646 [Dionaea muscipula]
MQDQLKDDADRGLGEFPRGDPKRYGGWVLVKGNGMAGKLNERKDDDAAPAMDVNTLLLAVVRKDDDVVPAMDVVDP